MKNVDDLAKKWYYYIRGENNGRKGASIMLKVQLITSIIEFMDLKETDTIIHQYIELDRLSTTTLKRIVEKITLMLDKKVS